MVLSDEEWQAARNERLRFLGHKQFATKNEQTLWLEGADFGYKVGTMPSKRERLTTAQLIKKYIDRRVRIRGTNYKGVVIQVTDGGFLRVNTTSWKPKQYESYHYECVRLLK